MAHSSYYKKRAPGQFKGITSHVHAGLNKFGSPNKISDNHLADMWEARPNNANDGIILGATTYSTSYWPGAYAAGEGEIVAMISDDTYVHIVTRDGIYGDEGTFEDWYVIDSDADTNTVLDISSYALGMTGVVSEGGVLTASGGGGFFCRLKTQAKTYICFFSYGQQKTLIYDYSTFTLVTLPFYPEAAVAHMDRIYAIDVGNTVWWCRAGDPFSWYGLESDDDRVVTLANMANGAYSIAAQPDVPRPLLFTVVKQATVDTLGTIAVVGTDYNDAALSETVTLVDGSKLSTYSYKTITSLTQSGWSAVSTTDKIKIGTAPVTGYLQADAGYWCLPTENNLAGLYSLNGRLYIAGENNTYVLDGYSYDTYSVSPALTGIGMYSYDSPCVVNGLVYFWFNYDLYEYDGQSHCVIINRPVLVNGQVTNGVYGGIAPQNLRLASDGWTLYAYESNLVKTHNCADDSDYNVNQLYYYAFDIKSRTWWLRAGIPLQYHDMSETWPAASFDIWYMPRDDAVGSMYTITKLQYGATGTPEWRFWLRMGSQYTDNYKTHIVTKAFNDGGSEDTTLTEINIVCRSYYAPYSDDDAEDNLKVYYSIGSYTPRYYLSNTTYAWTLLKAFSPSEIPDDLAVLSIPVIGSAIARAKSYMLKIEWESENELEIFGIERRFRTIGRSR